MCNKLNQIVQLFDGCANVYVFACLVCKVFWGSPDQDETRIVRCEFVGNIKFPENSVVKCIMMRIVICLEFCYTV